MPVQPIQVLHVPSCSEHNLAILAAIFNMQMSQIYIVLVRPQAEVDMQI